MFRKLDALVLEFADSEAWTAYISQLYIVSE